MKRTLLIFFIIFVLMQIIQMEKTNPTVNLKDEITAPKEIMEMFKNSCYDCHSNETTWPKYSYVAPISWIITKRVNNGRMALNFSTWQQYSKDEKKLKLKKIYRTIYAAMPLASYAQFHEEANLTKKQRNEIRDWTGARR